MAVDEEQRYICCMGKNLEQASGSEAAHSQPYHRSKKKKNTKTENLGSRLTWSKHSD